MSINPIYGETQYHIYESDKEGIMAVMKEAAGITP